MDQPDEVWPPPDDEEGQYDDDPVLTQLLHACRHANVAAVRAYAPLVGPDGLNRVSRGGETALHIASKNGYADVVRCLLALGARPEASTTRYSPLESACRNHHTETVALLLEASATVHEVGFQGATPLLSACCAGDLESIRLLLDADADVHQVTAMGTPLHAACEFTVDCVAVLLEHDADPNVAVHGMSPLQVAIDQPSLSVVQVLLAHGADRRDLNLADACPVIRDWLHRTRDWCTPLHHLPVISASRAHALLRGGACIHARRAAHSVSPLDVARELEEQKAAPVGTAAEMVLRASRPWSEATHSLFPPRAREWVSSSMLTAHRLARVYDNAGLVDVWREHVLPCAVRRDCCCAARPHTHQSRRRRRGRRRRHAEA